MTRTTVMDVTELLAAPVRTGIQRVVRALIRHWPKEGGQSLQLCRFVPSRGMVMVNDAVLPWLTDATSAARAASAEQIAAQIAPILADTSRALPDDQPILVTELFFDRERCAEHRRLLNRDRHRITYLVHDLIPWLHPAMIGVKTSAHLMPYLSLVRDAGRVCFTSAPIREEFAARIRRRVELSAAELDDIGPVIPLGSNGPPVPRQSFSPERRTYLCIGSIDGRKNQESVIQAFRMLWGRGSDARLVIVGRVFDQVRLVGGDAPLRALANEPRFSHVMDIPDDAFADLYAQARATIFASWREGYGLPPMESLLAGVPVIVSAQTPSIANLPPLGHIRIDPPDARAIYDAVLQMETDNTAELLWQEAAALAMPSWDETAARLAAWFTRGGGGA